MAISKKMTPIAPSATCAMQGALCKAEHALCWLRLRASVVRIGTERELPVRPCTCHAAHSGRQTIARRCHGGAPSHFSEGDASDLPRSANLDSEPSHCSEGARSGPPGSEPASGPK